MKDTTFVGLDVHKETIAVAVIQPRRDKSPRELGTIPNTPDAVAKLVRKLGPAQNLSFCYEAGPCGYTLYRQLTGLKAECVVVAPSLVPVRSGDRVKTDRRDAAKLVRCHRNGDLTPVWVPTPDHEALRDLVRGREDAVEDRQRARQRITQLLLRLGIHAPVGVRSWTVVHRRWLDALKLDQSGQQIVLREYPLALDQVSERIGRLEREIEELAKCSKLAPVIAALQAMRGIKLITAVTIAAETGDLTRFTEARQLMSYAGLVPSEHSSGSSQRRGSITKTGNAHLRRVVVEAAWHYRLPPRVSAVLKKRQEGLPEEVKAIAYNAQHRLNLKYRRMMVKDKPKQKVVVAIARELLGFVWAIAQAVKEHEHQMTTVA